MRTIILTATALVSLGAAPAFAHGSQGHSHNQQRQHYGTVDASCESDRRTSRNVGGFIGALGGASAGRALAAAAVRPEGVILGTVVGAIIGSSVGNAAVDCSPRALYTQDNGRSYGATHSNYAPHQGQHQQPQVRYYGHAQNYSQAPVYQPPVQQQPVYQQPVYQQQASQQQAYQGSYTLAGEDRRAAPPQEGYAASYQQQPYEDTYSLAGEDRRAPAPVAAYAAGYQQPIHQQHGHQQHGHQQPVQQSHQVVPGEDWYQPSPQSYYGQERRGPLAAAPPAYGRPDYVPADSYVVQQQQATVVVTQTYQAGGPVYAPQYAPQPMMMAPRSAPCGYHICR